jgi:hypothetical protein
VEGRVKGGDKWFAASAGHVCLTELGGHLGPRLLRYEEDSLAEREDLMTWLE